MSAVSVGQRVWWRATVSNYGHTRDYAAVVQRVNRTRVTICCVEAGGAGDGPGLKSVAFLTDSGDLRGAPGYVTSVKPAALRPREEGRPNA